ncbi:uncharacterized protein [Nicotiana tomentosiformis]|uniref:uncharacterized protein n=1 Tax=Nicotiana tomentosiformis TaxID=4098 RepID=UPI00388C81F4
MTTEKHAKCQILLSEFDIVYITQKAIKGHALADHLAENPVDGDYEPLTMYFPDEEELCKKFTKIEFKHVPRIQNEFDDALATLSFIIQHHGKNYIDHIEVEIKDQHAYCFHEDEEPDGKPWHHDIKRFLTAREYLDNDTNGQKRALKRLANHFFLNGKVLYKRTPDLGLLRCVDTAEATRLLEEIHAEMCVSHPNLGERDRRSTELPWSSKTA